MSKKKITTRGDYLGVILAAGHGSRMGPFGDRVPKPIAPICNRPLMAYQLEHMRSLGIEDVFVVVGHLAHRIAQVIGDGSAYGVNVHYVEQAERLGIAHAVGQLEPFIDRPFLLMLGDIFFEIDDLGRMVRDFEQHQAAAVLAVKEESDPKAIKRNFAVILDEQGEVRRVIEKPRHVANNLKGCGLYLFDLEIFEAISRTPRTAMRDEYEITDSIQILINYEYGVRAAPVVEWDMNLTYIGDLLACCRQQLGRLGETSLVGRDCAIGEDVTLLETVVGDRASIRGPVRLERCVVLEGVDVTEGDYYADTVFTEDGALPVLSNGY